MIMQAREINSRPQIWRKPFPRPWTSRPCKGSEADTAWIIVWERVCFSGHQGRSRRMHMPKGMFRPLKGDVTLALSSKAIMSYRSSTRARWSLTTRLQSRVAYRITDFPSFVFRLYPARIHYLQSRISKALQNLSTLFKEPRIDQAPLFIAFKMEIFDQPLKMVR